MTLKLKWATAGLLFGLGFLGLAIVGWIQDWSWADDLWRSLFIEIGSGLLLAAGGVLVVSRFQSIVARQQQETVRVIREELRPPTSEPSRRRSAADFQCPDLADVQILTPVVDISSGDALLRVRVRLIDRPAGIGGKYSSYVYFRSPSHFAIGTGGQYADLLFESHTRVSGDEHDGWYEAERPIPQHSEPGTWRVEFLQLADSVGNTCRLTGDEVAEMGFPVTFEVVDT